MLVINVGGEVAKSSPALAPKYHLLFCNCALQSDTKKQIIIKKNRCIISQLGKQMFFLALIYRIGFYKLRLFGLHLLI